ncbi:VanZ like family protein [Lachnospiraceae bacterium NK3A20]|nr:VanZ like family protein [Lachnospiraceae bacterium NK3A20]
MGSMNYFALFLKKTLRFLLKPLSFVPALLVMIMIFGFSAQPADESGDLSIEVTERIVHTINYRLHMNWSPEEQVHYVEKAEFYVRKLAHFSEYCLLAITLAIPLYVYGVRGGWLFLLTILLCFVYACSDEYHQSFISGRSPQLRDVLIDTAGGLLGTLLSHPFLVLGRKTIFAPLSLEKERRIRKAYEKSRERAEYQPSHESRERAKYRPSHRAHGTARPSDSEYNERTPEKRYPHRPYDAPDVAEHHDAERRKPEGGSHDGPNSNDGPTRQL